MNEIRTKQASEWGSLLSKFIPYGGQAGGVLEPTSEAEHLAPPVSEPNSFFNRTPDIFRPALAVVVSLALLLRAWNFYLLGLDHYDEGIYALSGFWSLSSHAVQAWYPFQKLFSPPGYFGLIGLAYRLRGGASDSAAIGINILFGAATVAHAGWAGRRWFGPSCGLAAAILVAGNNFEIIFARTGLTDTLFAFLFLLTLALIAISLERNSFAWALLAGVAGGISWNVKYDGWLPAAIAFAGIVLLAVKRRRVDSDLKRNILVWATVAGITVALFLPWVIYTQERLGGYLAVEAFHSKFVDFNWFENLLAQVQAQFYLDGFLSHVAPLAALLMAIASDEGGDSKRWRSVGLVVAGFVLSVMVFGGVGTCIILALTGLHAAWRRGGTFGPILVCGVSFLSLVIPLYTAYPRLLLPWILMIQILAAAGIQVTLSAARRLPAFAEMSDHHKGRQISVAICLAGLLAVTGIAIRRSIPRVDPWNAAAKDSVRNAVTAAAQMIPPGSVVFVQEEPDAAFYFRKTGFATLCVMHLVDTDGVPEPFNYSTPSPVYLVAGAYALSSPAWNPLPPEIMARVQPLARIPIRPGDVRLLDDLGTEGALQYRQHPDDRYSLLLLRVVPAQHKISPPVAR